MEILLRPGVFGVRVLQLAGDLEPLARGARSLVRFVQRGELVAQRAEIDRLGEALQVGEGALLVLSDLLALCLQGGDLLGQLVVARRAEVVDPGGFRTGVAGRLRGFDLGEEGLR